MPFLSSNQQCQSTEAHLKLTSRSAVYLTKTEVPWIPWRGGGCLVKPLVGSQTPIPQLCTLSDNGMVWYSRVLNKYKHVSNAYL